MSGQFCKTGNITLRIIIIIIIIIMIIIIIIIIIIIGTNTAFKSKGCEREILQYKCNYWLAWTNWLQRWSADESIHCSIGW